jgi:hypothetical protein
MYHQSLHQTSSEDLHDLKAAVLPGIHKKLIPRIEAACWLSSTIDSLQIPEVPEDVFFGVRPMMLQKIDVLRYAESPERIRFFNLLKEQVFERKDLRMFLVAAFGRASHFLSDEERRVILGDLLQGPHRSSASLLIAQVLTNAGGRSATLRLIRFIGEEQLLNRRSILLREIHAICVLGKTLSALPLPPSCSKYFSHPIRIKERYKEVLSALRLAFDKVKEDRRFSGLQVQREYKSAIKTNIRDFIRQFKEADSTPLKREIINRTLKRHILETRYVIKLSGSWENQSEHSRQWTSAELGLVEWALKRLPESAVLFSPGVYEIRRVDMFRHSSEQGNVALYETGVNLIRMTDYTKIKTGLIKAKDYLAITLLHEIGHAFNINGLDVNSTFKIPVPKYPDFLLDIFGADFLNLSGWQIVKSGYKLLNENLSVKLGERIYPLGRPVSVDGTLRIFHYNEMTKCLFSYRVSEEKPAGFAEGRNAESDPFEDWSDAFADYCTRPHHLIESAPLKYVYMESLFRSYDHNSRLRNHAKERLTLRRGTIIEPRSSHLYQEDIASRTFRRLSLYERALLVNEVGTTSTKGADHNDSNLGLALDSSKLQRSFAVAWNRRPKKCRDALARYLLHYNPFVLRALRLIEEGKHIAVFADRADKSSSGSVRRILEDLLLSFFGEGFNKDRLYLLDDPLRSQRLKKSNSIEKTAAILTEFTRGSSVRADGLVKPLTQSYKRVRYYDSSIERLRAVSGIMQGADAISKITFLSPRHVEPSAEISSLMVASPCADIDEIHVFALDDGLVNLDASYQVVHSSGDILLNVSSREFHSNPDPTYWRKKAWRMYQNLPLHSVLWDDSRFSEASVVQQLVKDAREFNRAFRKN